MKKATKFIVRALVWISFLLYILALYYLLFVAYGREHWGEISRIEYALKNIKLIPFETIRAYIRAIKYGYMNSSIPVTNLLGNFVLLLPLGFYLPLFFKSLKRFLPYIFVIVLIIFGIETTQFLFMRGIFDIDDFMLNMLGAMAGFFVWKMKIVQWIEKAYRKDNGSTS